MVAKGQGAGHRTAGDGLQSLGQLDSYFLVGEERKFKGRAILVGNRSLSSPEACTSSVGSVPVADICVR